MALDQREEAYSLLDGLFSTASVGLAFYDTELRCVRINQYLAALTNNVAININAPNYVKWIGGKWFLSELKKFMLSKLGIEMTNHAFFDIQRCITKSLLAVQKLVTNSPNSFELYGFDVLIDDTCKPWLIEINASPSLTTTTKRDR